MACFHVPSVAEGGHGGDDSGWFVKADVEAVNSVRRGASCTYPRELGRDPFFGNIFASIRTGRARRGRYTMKLRPRVERVQLFIHNFVFLPFVFVAMWRRKDSVYPMTS